MKQFLSFAVTRVAVLALAAAPMLMLHAQAPAAPTAAPPAAAPGRGGPPRMPQGGRGPIKVLLITKGHEFEREPFFQMFDAIGNDITYTHVEHPAAQKFMEPAMAKDYDVFVYYDLAGPGVRTAKPDGTFERVYPPPSPELKKNFEALVKQGKGMVFLHHASAGWAHHWPEYSEVIGGACDWYAPTTIRGFDHPNMGYFGNTTQHETIVDKTHPITQGLGDAIDIVDEAYSCAFFEDTVHPLIRTDFKPVDHDKNLNPKWPFSNLAAWWKVSERSPVVFLQNGHGPTAWANPAYRILLANSIKWAASKEAMDWAAANPTKIFK